MATFGWVREDGMDAFFEGTDRVPDPGPAPEPTFSCPFCKAAVGDRLRIPQKKGTYSTRSRAAIPREGGQLV